VKEGRRNNISLNFQGSDNKKGETTAIGWVPPFSSNAAPEALEATSHTFSLKMVENKDAASPAQYTLKIHALNRPSVECARSFAAITRSIWI